MDRRKKKVPEIYIQRRRMFLIAVALLLVLIIALVIGLRKPKEPVEGTQSDASPSSTDSNTEDTDDKDSKNKVSGQIPEDEDSAEIPLDLDAIDEELTGRLEKMGTDQELEDQTIEGNELMLSRISNSPDASPNEPPSSTRKVAQTDWKMILVNEVTPLPNDFAISTVKIGDSEVDARIEDSLVKMMMAAKADGIPLKLISGYRSVERQKDIYNVKLNEYLNSGLSKEIAVLYTEMYIQIPRYSEHHTGLAVDVVTPSYTRLDAGFANTAAAKWLRENGASYGFILRYPEGKDKVTGISFEPWHYRYVGVTVAKEIMTKGYCLEEYIYIQEKEAKKTT